MKVCEFKVGDIAELKSGSKAMTISELVNDEAVCYYWDGHNVIRLNIPIIALRKI